MQLSKDTRYHGQLGDTQVHTDPALGLDTSSSSLELTAVAGLFTAGKATLRCEATIYDLYRGVDQAEVLEDTPHLAPVMGPTAPHSQEDVVGECSTVYVGFRLGSQKKHNFPHSVIYFSRPYNF